MEILQSSSQPALQSAQAAVISLAGTDGTVTPEQPQGSPSFGQLLASLVADGGGEERGGTAGCQGVDLTPQPDATLTGEKLNPASDHPPTGAETLLPSIPVQIAVSTLVTAPEAKLTRGSVEGGEGQTSPPEKNALPDDAKNSTTEIDPAVLLAAVSVHLVQPSLPANIRPEPGPSQGNGEAGGVGGLTGAGTDSGTGMAQILTQTAAPPNQADTKTPLGESPLPAGFSTGDGENVPVTQTQTHPQPAEGKGVVLPQETAAGGRKADADIPARHQPGTNLPETVEVSGKADPPGAAKMVVADTSLNRSGRGTSTTGPALADKPIRTVHPAGGEVAVEPSQVDVIFQDAPANEGASSGDEGGEQHLGEKGKDASAPSPMASAAGSYKTHEENRVSPQTNVETAKGSEHEHIMAQVKEKLAAIDSRSGNGQVILKLHPEGLGELKINVQMVDQRLKVEVVAQNPLVKEALMQNLDTLKETLSRQNIAMEKFDVSTGGGQGFDQAYREGRQTVYDRHQTPYVRYSPAGDETEEETVVSYGRPQENSLVDVRF